MKTKSIRFTDDELNRRVLSAIRQYQPTFDRRMSKEDMSLWIYGYYNESSDRAIRDAVTELVLDGHPICATSDQPGYYMARSYEEALPCIAELQSRREIFDQKIQGIKRGLVSKAVEPTQMQLI